MKLSQPFRRTGEHLEVELGGARALFTTRRGGFSTGPYTSLNLGRSTGDDPGAVQRNRDLLERALGVRFAYGRQVHGTTVHRVQAESAQASPPVQADGQATAQAGIGAMVLTADCLPIAVAGGGAVVMMHAGWRGLAAGVVAEGLRALSELGAKPPLVAAIGPGAGPCCYEVGEEIHTLFAAHGPIARRGGNLDLKAIAACELERAGADEVHDVGLCTICSELFFSHRRERGITGRQAGIAWLS